MKQRFTTITLFLIFAAGVVAQELQPEVKAVVDACVMMRSAVQTGDMDGLRQSNIKLKACKVGNFASFRVDENTVEPTLDGHFVFEPEFVDSLLSKGKQGVYQYAQQYAKKSVKRGTSTTQKVYMRTISLQKGGTAVYRYSGNGHMELAMVTEPGGLISMKVVNKKTGEVYKSYDNEKTGQSSRVLTFDLPTDSNTRLEVQIANYSDSVISCVVISN